MEDDTARKLSRLDKFRKNIRGSPLFRVIQPSKTKVCKLYLTSD